MAVPGIRVRIHGSDIGRRAGGQAGGIGSSAVRHVVPVDETRFSVVDAELVVIEVPDSRRTLIPVVSLERTGVGGEEILHAVHLLGVVVLTIEVVGSLEVDRLLFAAGHPGHVESVVAVARYGLDAEIARQLRARALLAVVAPDQRRQRRKHAGRVRQQRCKRITRVARIDGSRRAWGQALRNGQSLGAVVGRLRGGAVVRRLAAAAAAGQGKDSRHGDGDGEAVERSSVHLDLLRPRCRGSGFTVCLGGGRILLVRDVPQPEASGASGMAESPRAVHMASTGAS